MADLTWDDVGTAEGAPSKTLLGWDDVGTAVPGTGFRSGLVAPDNSPEMRALLAPSAPKVESSAPQQEPSFTQNTLTGLTRIPGTVLGLPHMAVEGYQGVAGKGPVSNWLLNNTITQEQEDQLFRDSLAKAGLPVTPYQPQTPLGDFWQNAVSGIGASGIGGGGLMGLLGRQAQNVGGAGLGEVAKVVAPDSPGLQTAATIAGAALGDRAIPLTAGTARMGAQLFATKGATDAAAAKRLLDAANVTKPSLIESIDQNLPNWQFPGIAGDRQPIPPTAAVTQNPGLLSMTYNDMVSAKRANNPIYTNNADVTNAAQRQAVANVSPDFTPDITTNRDLINNTVSGFPTGVTAQDAGANFRTGLQNVYDQRLAARRAAGSELDMLSSSPAQISLRPVMDYATQQAAQNAGEVGSAYNAARGQFSSGTGITLDTAPFAQSVLAGLGDLGMSYPKGSAANRAVVDVLNRAKQAVYDQAPEIEAARGRYATAAAPLDVFNPEKTPGPIANAVEKTPAGIYTNPNDAVVSQFLRSTGAPDAIDRLNSVFPDPKAATQSLRDYIGSQVQANAVNPDGSINLTKLQATIKPFAPVLNKLPFAGLKRDFGTIEGAQKQVDLLTKRQGIVDEFQSGLGLQQTDMNGAPYYSPKKFDDFVNRNSGDLVSIYGQEGVDRLNQINKQLSDVAQIAQARVPGTSGTAQTLREGSGNVLSTMIAQHLGTDIAELAGAVMSHGSAGHILGAGALGDVTGVVSSKLMGRYNAKVSDTLTNALADPNYASALLAKYNPKMPTTAGTRALNYVLNHGMGYAAPLENQSK